MKKWLLGGGVVLLLFFSVLWHLPAQWVASQLTQSEKLHFEVFSMGMESFQGRWHKGGATLYQRSNHFPQFKLFWQLPGISILWGMPVLKLKALDFYAASQKVEAQWKIELWQKNIKLQYFKSKLAFPTLARWARAGELADPAQLNLLSGIEGTLIWQDLSFDLPFAQLYKVRPWPQNLQGSGQILGLNVMDMVKIPKLTFKLSQKGYAPIHFSLKGGDKSWQLSGQGQFYYEKGVFPRLSFHIEVNSEPGTPLPDWVPMVMREVSPTKAVLEQKE